MKVPSVLGALTSPRSYRGLLLREAENPTFFTASMS